MDFAKAIRWKSIETGCISDGSWCRPRNPTRRLAGFFPSFDKAASEGAIVSQPDLADDEAPVLEEEQPAAPEPARPRVEVPTQKQKTSIYTVMLMISFVCIVIACILLAWELSLWGPYPWWNVRDAIPR